MFYLKKSFFLIHHVLFVFHSLFKNVANAQSESLLYNDSMDNGPFEQSSGYGLAIEMSCSQGSVTLCHNDLELDTLSIPQPHRHAIELMPTIDQLCKRHQVGPKQIGEIYVSIGPGSFTGLRIAVATAKLFASVVGSRLVTVPTIDVVAENAPCYALSFESGKPVATNSSDTLADGMACRTPDPAAVEVILRGAERIVKVSEDEILAAMGHYFTDTHNAAEGAGAAPLAALLKERDKMARKRVGLILSGGNADKDLFARALG